MKIDIRRYKRRGKKQKLLTIIQNNALANTVLRVHKGKISDKFFIRCIEVLCKENKHLLDTIVTMRETETHYNFRNF